MFEFCSSTTPALTSRNNLPAFFRPLPTFRAIVSFSKLRTQVSPLRDCASALGTLCFSYQSNAGGMHNVIQFSLQLPLNRANTQAYISPSGCFPYGAGILYI